MGIADTEESCTEERHIIRCVLRRVRIKSSDKEALLTDMVPKYGSA
jgi:hypothetical protein